MNKTLFFDTCSLIQNYNLIFNKDNNYNFYLSSITLKELEDIKSSGTKDEETKYNARQVLHLLENNRSRYNVILYRDSYLDVIQAFDLPVNNDSKIISCAYWVLKNIDAGIVFATEDLACQELARAIGLPTFKIGATVEEYSGYKEVDLNDMQLAEFYSDITNNRFELLENEYLVIKLNGKTIKEQYKWHNGCYETVPYRAIESKMFGKVSPKNGDIYQKMAFDSLSNNQITVLRGPAGSGKSYAAFAYMFSLLEKGKIDKIIIFCNTIAARGAAKLGLI